MNFILLVGFVLVVAGTITRFLIDGCNSLPIDNRPLPLPPSLHTSQTNTVDTAEYPAGQILSIVTNAEYLVEADVDKSTNLVNWVNIAHLSISLPEQDGATGSSGFDDGYASGTMTASVSGEAAAVLPGIALNQPKFLLPHPPKCVFYRLNNFAAWRNVYYTVQVSSGSNP